MTLRRVVAWGLVGLTIGLIVAGAAVDVRSVVAGASVIVLAFIAFAVVGALVVTRAPRNVVGPLLLAIGVMGAASAVFADAWVSADPPLPGRGWAELFATIGAFGWIAPLALVLFRFPDGAPLSRRWLTVERLVLFTWIVLMVLVALLPFEDYPGIANPIAVDSLAEPLETIAGVAYLVSIVTLPLAAGSFVVRFRRSRGDERRRLKWLAFGAALIGFGIGLLSLSYLLPLGDRPDEHLVGQLLVLPFIVGMLFFPAAAGIGILRYRLFDIDVVIRKAVIFAILVALLTVIFFLGAVTLGGLVARSVGAATAFAFGVGLLVVPMWRLSRGIADRVVYGGRASPSEVLSAFADRLSETYAADDVLPRMAAILGEATRANDATVWVRVGGQFREGAIWPEVVDRAPPVAATGDALPAFPGADHVSEIRDRGELLGAVTVSLPANDPIDASREQLVRDLASQAGLVLRNVRLIEELRASRQRLVTAQDEERRKLERDIHDGAQQQLVALAVKERLAESFVGTDDDRARAMLAEIRDDTVEVLDTLRDLARGIYPPLLADRGLAEALEAQARKSSVPIAVDADGVGRYPQEVEAAVYFTVLEALQNVAKYAEAEHAEVHLSDGTGGLRFEVVDDGVGFDPTAVQAGTGLQGMADRLEAIGGRLAIDSAPGGGTRIAGSVPASAGDRP